MKALRCILIIVFFVITSCTEEVKEIETSDLSAYHMKIIPDRPNSHNQIKLVIYDDCTYNVLSEVSRDGQFILIAKQFNSMMKWPCIMKNDTIEIGRLPSGNYIIHYKLTDISTQVANPDVLSLFFHLIVSE
ncbi:MAG: hypothetical protein ACM3O8_06690 [Methylococcaceae bacterium]|nr:hypothetical protein [Prolixibacteraceae bacterium]